MSPIDEITDQNTILEVKKVISSVTKAANGNNSSLQNILKSVLNVLDESIKNAKPESKTKEAKSIAKQILGTALDNEGAIDYLNGILSQLEEKSPKTDSGVSDAVKSTDITADDNSSNNSGDAGGANGANATITETKAQPQATENNAKPVQGIIGTESERTIKNKKEFEAKVKRIRDDPLSVFDIEEDAEISNLSIPKFSKIRNSTTRAKSMQNENNNDQFAAAQAAQAQQPQIQPQAVMQQQQPLQPQMQQIQPQAQQPAQQPVQQPQIQPQMQQYDQVAQQMPFQNGMGIQQMQQMPQTPQAPQLQQPMFTPQFNQQPQLQPGFGQIPPAQIGAYLTNIASGLMSAGSTMMELANLLKQQK